MREQLQNNSLKYVSARICTDAGTAAPTGRTAGSPVVGVGFRAVVVIDVPWGVADQYLD